MAAVATLGDNSLKTLAQKTFSSFALKKFPQGDMTAYPGLSGVQALANTFMGQLALPKSVPQTEMILGMPPK